MLKAVLSKLEEVPEALRSLYAEQDGKFVLQVEGLVTKDKLDEFRTNNIKLAKDLDTLKNKIETLKDIDPTEYKSMKEKLQAIDEKKLMDAGEFQKVLEQRTAQMKKDFETQRAAMETSINGLTKERDTLNGRLSEVLIDGTIRDVATKAKVRATAIEDVLLRGKRVWKLQDGKPVPVDDQGNLIYGKNGTAPMTVDEWIAGLQGSAGHLFESSSGSGAGNAGGSNFQPGVVNIRDQAALNANIAEIAAGKVTVTQ